jgi:uncharacterized membrane protein
MAYLYYADPTPKEFTKDWSLWTHAQQRIGLTWIMTAVAGFTVYHELDPRARLAFWALTAALNYRLGRERGEEHLKKQGAVLAIGTGIEGAFSYLLFPKGLLATPNATDIAIYWGAAFVLLYNLFAAKDEKTPRTGTDFQAAWVFAFLSMGMMAFFLAKELQSYNLTVAWAAEGFAFLIAGVFFNAFELRYPALMLLAVCTGKALLIDTSQLELPQRVATFLALGGILIGASMVYVHVGKPHEKGPTSDPN